MGNILISGAEYDEKKDVSDTPSAKIGLEDTIVVKTRETANDLLNQYLTRLNFKDEEIEAVLSSQPSFELMTDLLARHGKYIPFENLDQHEHPAGVSCSRVNQVWGLNDTDGHDRIKNPEHIIRKYINGGRGGFCFELNSSMHWLLTKLRFNPRLCLSRVCKPNGVYSTVGSHCCNLVTFGDEVWLVDAGFGWNLVPVPLNGKIVKESTGDLMKVLKCELGNGYDFALWRKHLIAGSDTFSGDTLHPASDTRSNEEGFICQFAFRSGDNLSYGNEEFCKGITHVLRDDISPFRRGRICSKLTDKGRITFAKQRIQWTEGKHIIRKEFLSEDEVRAALLKYFGLRLGVLVT